ncbi:TIGR03619 family F420-dependent LLM class oxidoreductase [Mycobacterium sp. SVM_VP21]|nr:TIGR03619 family F420-dependent LLM class oxidoreductase [Mycobacterium sp. SVM_VP21]
MRFMILLPNCMQVAALSQSWEKEVAGRDIAGVTAAAEGLGYSMVVLPEHFLIPTAHRELSGDHYFEASTAQAFIAGATSTITVGSMVTILPLHHPVVIAKAIATLDWFSGGRSLVTFGVGWLKEEYDAMGVPFHLRGRMADEYLEAINELWMSESPCMEGEFVSFDNVAFGPKPARRPTVWIGGDADAALRRAARFGDGWAPWLTKPTDLPARIDYLRSQPGFDDRPFAVSYSLAGLNIGEGHAVVSDPGSRIGESAEQIIDSCGRLTELGVTHTWVNPPALAGLDAYLDHMRWVAQEVIPKAQ